MFGFPGETEEEFEDTYNLLKEIKLYKIHVFQYSKRNGTRAVSFPNQVPSNIKEERSKEIIELSNQVQKEYNMSYIGKEIDVLIEENDNNYYKGHTKNYIYVKVKSSTKNIENTIVRAKVVDVQDEYLVAIF